MKARLCLLLSLVCCASGRAQTLSGSGEIARSIAESHRLYFLAFAIGDSALFIYRYATDCWIMPPNASALCGEEAPLDYFRETYYTRGVRNGRFITTDIYGDSGEYVTELGFFQLFDARDSVIDNGKFLILWKRTPAGWKMFRDSFSSDRDKQVRVSARGRTGISSISSDRR